MTTWPRRVNADWYSIYSQSSHGGTKTADVHVRSRREALGTWAFCRLQAAVHFILDGHPECARFILVYAFEFRVRDCSNEPENAKSSPPTTNSTAKCQTLAILSKLLTPKFYHFLFSQSQSFSARISGYRTCCAQMGKSPVVVQFQVYRYITHFISITYRLVYRFVNLFANKKQPISL